MTTSPAIVIESLTKSYGDKRVLQGLDLVIPAGGVLALLGPNGAGKTTTVEILQGLRRRDGGNVTVLGHDPQRSSRAWKARIGVVSQTSADFKDLTVTEAVSHVARFFAQPADVAKFGKAITLPASPMHFALSPSSLPTPPNRLCLFPPDARGLSRCSRVWRVWR